jgi:hypothetical protein
MMSETDPIIKKFFPLPADVKEALKQTEHRRKARTRTPIKVVRTGIDLPRDIRLYNKVLLFTLLCIQKGIIRAIGIKFSYFVMRQAIRLWKARLFIHSARLYLRWRFSRERNYEEQTRLLAICVQKCEWVIKFEPGNDKGVSRGYYCRACGCGYKPRALLTNKLRRKGYQCPKGIHPGTTVDPYMGQMSCIEQKDGSKDDGNTKVAGTGSSDQTKDHGNGRGNFGR